MFSNGFNWIILSARLSLFSTSGLIESYAMNEILALDVLLLSRLQFAFTIMFHYIFPPLTIGLGVLLVILEGLYLKTGDKQYEAAAKFWTKIFALNFAMGIVTGIVMEFQFGTNWATYSRFVGDVFGAALAAEGIFAFFLESGFLAVLVFGWDRVSSRMHFFSTIMVSLGSIFSSVWIVVANSWQQTPAGYARVFNDETGMWRAELTDFWVAVFNHSSVHRLVHVWIGAFILGAFFVMSITAFYILRKQHEDFARKSFKAALWVGAVSSVAALVHGHMQANNVYEHQPAKLAAFEGQFKTETNAPLHIFGWPNEETQSVDLSVAIPGMLSFLIFEDTNAEVIGLDQFPREDWPPVLLSFQSYHLMVALGMFFIGLTLFGLLMLWRGKLFETRWLLWIFVFAVVGPFVANQAGWVAAEVGRQPWIVYGELRTADALSPSVEAWEVLSSIIVFGIIYTMLFAIWVFLLDNKIRTGPELPTPEGEKGKQGFFDVATERADTGRDSMTDAHPREKE